ncbi:MAG: AAA family ATPase [Candidatus Limnocylindrales bacterium]
MTCRTCGRALEPGSRFCPACGTPTDGACTSCGASLPDGARFCPACGQPTAGSEPTDSVPPTDKAMRERKIASMVFADLVGYTSLNEAADPELVQALVTRAFDRLSTEVARYEGTVEKFAGDAMLAVFGVPVTHEDDAERAVRSALEMQAAMGELAAELHAEGRPELSLRIGVETGEVLVDLARASGERDRIVTGDPVNTASRLQGVARPGTIVVGPFTYAATRDVVEYEELPPASLKGKALPVAAWRAVAVKARRGGLRATLGIEAPLIGRDEEIALLKETVRRTVVEGRPHLVTVVGSAGVGKSRLTWELEKYLDGLPDVYHWRKGRCLAYAQASYSALADAVKQDARILDDDSPDTAVAKIELRLGELGTDDPELLVALRALLALGAVGDQAREGLFEAWRRYLEAIAAANPLVLVLEDIHWADDGLLDAIEFLARWTEGRLMLLCLARHELLERRPTWGGGIPNATTIVLEPLDAAKSLELVEGLLPGGLPASLCDRVVALAEGNPLFTEELVRMFVDRGVLRYADGAWELARPIEEVEVPGTVQAVLSARLDTLPPGEKRLAQDAAVVGRIFWDAIVAHLARQPTHVADEVLRSLRVKELVVPRQPSTLAGAAEFGFRHVLIRDVAYDSLPKRDRAVKHLAVVDWAERELADRREEFAELLASHQLAALRYEEEFDTGGPRLDAVRRRTFELALVAGRRAASLSARDRVAAWMRVAWELGRRLGLPVREQAALAIEYVETSSAGEDMERLRDASVAGLEAMLTIEEPTADDEQLIAQLRVDTGSGWFFAGQAETARSFFEAGIAALEGGPPTRGRARLLAALGWLSWRVGPVDSAPVILERALAEAQAIGDAAIERLAMHDLGIAESMTGRRQDGLRRVRESRELARDAGDINLFLRATNNLASTSMGNGDPWPEILSVIEEGLGIARRSVEHGFISWLAGTKSDLLTLLGRMDEALTTIEEGIAAAEAISVQDSLAGRLGGRGFVRWTMGDREGAVEDWARARALVPEVEPQAVMYVAVEEALPRWDADPEGAVAVMVEAAADPSSTASAAEGALWLARMALRTRDRQALEVARSLVDVGIEGATGESLRRVRDHVHALAVDPPDLDGLISAAEGLEALGYLGLAVDTWADAALIAARVGADATPHQEHAAELYATCHMVPALGPLPETRWIAGVGSSSAVG